MGSTFTMYGRGQMLQAMLNPDDYAPVATYGVALTRYPPANNSSIDQLIEPDATLGYARASYPTTAAKWVSTGFAEFYNVDPIEFAQVTSDWGLISGWALLDVLAGQCVAVGSLGNPFSAVSGMIPVLDSGAIMLGLYD